MKKVLILLLLSMTVFSQGIGYGIKAGITSASNSEEDETKSGFVLGGTLTLDVIITTLDVEAIFQSYGDDDGTINTIQSPATVRIGLLPIPMASLYLRAGVQYDHLIGGKSDKSPSFENQIDQFGQSGLSIVVGAGLELDIPVLPGAMIDVRYIIPTYNFLSDEFYKGLDLKKSSVSNLQMTFGINF